MKVHVSFDVEVPVDHVTDDQVREWVEFQLGWNGRMDGRLADLLGEMTAHGRPIVLCDRTPEAST